MINTLDQTIEVENPAEVLRNVDGTFDVTSPYGHIFQVRCRRGAKMTVRQIVEPKLPVANPGVIWRIRRKESPRDLSDVSPVEACGIAKQ